MRYVVIFRGLATQRDGELLPDSEDFLEEHLDQVMEELLGIGVGDPAVGGSLAHGLVEVSVAVEATTLEEARKEGGGQIRTALHAAGAVTAGWDESWAEAIPSDKAEAAEWSIHATGLSTERSDPVPA